MWTKLPPQGTETRDPACDVGNETAKTVKLKMDYTRRVLLQIG